MQVGESVRNTVPSNYDIGGRERSSNPACNTVYIYIHLRLACLISSLCLRFLGEKGDILVSIGPAAPVAAEVDIGVGVARTASI